VNAINAQAIADYLIYLIQGNEETWSDDGDEPTVRSFEDAAVLSLTTGTIRTAFQIGTLVQRKN
jgi:hypothetical protein